MVTTSRNTAAPTYQLNPDSTSADQFYRDVGSLVDDVLEGGLPLRGLTEGYRVFSATRTGAQQASHEEALLDLLTLGVLWIARGREAIMQTPAQRNLVSELVRERRNQCGRRRDGSQNALLDFGVPLDFSALQPSLHDLERLQNWLFATGEYDDEVGRISNLVAFLTGPSGRPRPDALRLITSLACDFAKRAETRLARYTQEVDRFLIEQLPLRCQREDAAQCSKKRVEYHLNLFAAELLNRVWRDDFLACKTHVVVLSGCLRTHQDGLCRASRAETSLSCSHCTKACTVSSVTRLAQRYGATTVAVIHGSDFSRFLRAAQAGGAGTGIIGVACAPGIMGAGLRARALGMPAQCVVLHASGCDHWRARGIASSFDLGELERLLSGRARASAGHRERVQACR